MTFTPERSDAIRTGLVSTVSHASRRNRVLAGVGLALAGTLLGAGTATAIATQGWLVPEIRVASAPPRPSLPDPASTPSGLLPGMPIVTAVGSPASWIIDDTTEISLVDRPPEATHVRVITTCLSPGRFSWGTDAGGNNLWALCSPPDAGGEVWYDFPLNTAVTTLYLDVETRMEIVVTLQYLVYLPTKFGVNERGETYGVEGYDQGTPDLVAAEGVAPDGREIRGYVQATDLDTFGPDHPRMPRSPEEAIRWQKERDEQYPDGWDVPLYESDGVTQIGTHHVG